MQWDGVRPAQLHTRRAHGLAGVLGLEYGGVAGFLEDLAYEPVEPAKLA